MNRKTLLSILFICGFLSACSSEGPDLIKVTTPVSTPAFLKHSMVIDKVSYVHPVLIDGPLVGDYKEALEKTFDSEMLSAPDGQQPKYKVSVDFDMDADVSIFDPHESYAFTANYMIFQSPDDKKIFDKKIVTKCEGERISMWRTMLVGPINSGAQATQLQRIYCSVHDNIEEFLQSLNTMRD
jgi:hypothetical protein